jgi:hypothetical protein
VARRRSSGPPTRGRSRLQPRREILLFVEGEKTEEDYFLHWYRLHQRHVIVTIDKFHGSPIKLVERAESIRKRELYEARRGRGRAHDEIWCVFDIDNHPSVNEAVQRAEGNGIHVAISNPCFELWFILHFEDQNAHINAKQAQARAQALLRCGKALTPAALATLEANFDDAQIRARRLHQKHIGDGSPPHTNPSTQVWKLVGNIRSASA